MKPDVVVVGSGMSGAAAAWYLSEHGHNVLVIESGVDISPADLPTASIDWENKKDSAFSPVASKRTNLGDYPVDDKTSPIAVCNFNAVGGSSILYSAHFPRFLRPDLRSFSENGIGKDWPIHYDELLPFFDLNEKQMRVSGKVGDVYYPDLHQVYNSPVPLGIAGEKMAAGFDKLQWHWWPSFAAINTDRPLPGRLTCHGLGPCNTGCPMEAKATAKNTYLRQALKKRVRLLSANSVSRLIMRGSTVVSVEVIGSDGNRFQIDCKRIVLAAGAIGTPRILLNSLDLAKHEIPGGHLIGKNLMMHPLGYAEGFFADKIHTEKGPQGVMLYSLEFYRPKEQTDFKLGFMMHALRGAAPVDTVKTLYARRQLQFGHALYQQFIENYGHTVGIAIICEDLPEMTNRVELDYANRDRLGLPGVKVFYELSQNSRRMMSYGLRKARQVLTSAGAMKTSGFGPVRNTGWHLFGTACMGENPSQSVVDSRGAVHGLRGVYVFDASVFPSSSCVNPANTIQAVSLYLADKLDRAIRNENY